MAFTKADWPYYSCMLGAALPYSFPRPLFQIEVKCVQFPSTRVRNFLNPQLIFFRIQKFPRPHVSVFKSNLPVHTYSDSLSIRQLIYKAISGSCENFIANLLQQMFHQQNCPTKH